MHLGQSLAPSELFPHRNEHLFTFRVGCPWQWHGAGMEIRSELDLAYHPKEGQFTNLSVCLKVTQELRLILCYLG